MPPLCLTHQKTASKIQNVAKTASMIDTLAQDTVSWIYIPYPSRQLQPFPSTSSQQSFFGIRGQRVWGLYCMVWILDEVLQGGLPDRRIRVCAIGMFL